MENQEKVLSPTQGATPACGAGAGADTQPQSIVHEFSEYNRATGRTEYGQWGVEYRSANEIIIHNDYIAHFYGFGTVYENRYEIKICNKIAKVKHIYNYFHQPSMWIYEAEDNHVVRDVGTLKKIIKRAYEKAKEGKRRGFDRVCEELIQLLRGEDS